MKFAGALRRLAGSVAAPPAVRLRILTEVEADLQDLYRELRAEGLSDAEARHRATLLLVPDEVAVAALARVHRPLWQRWRERYSGSGRRGERLLLCGLGVAGSGVAWAAVARNGLLAAASPFVFVLLGIGTLATVHAFAHATRVWGTGDSAGARIRAGSGTQLWAALAALTVAAFGTIHGLYGAATAIQTAPTRQGELVLEWVRASVVLGVLGITISIFCGLCWIFFVYRAAVVEQRERALFGPVLNVCRDVLQAGNDGLSLRRSARR